MGIKDMLKNMSANRQPQPVFRKVTPDEKELEGYHERERLTNIHNELMIRRKMESKKNWSENTFLSGKDTLCGSKNIWRQNAKRT